MLLYGAYTSLHRRAGGRRNLGICRGNYHSELLTFPILFVIWLISVREKVFMHFLMLIKEKMLLWGQGGGGDGQG